MTRPRRRALVATGLGEFVDAYDLIVISGALIALKPHFHLGAGELGWLSAAAFFGSAVGAAFFGDLVDRIGRRRVFVLNLIAFVGLALVSAVLIAAGLYEWLGTESWRVMFAVGALPAVAVLSLRRGLPDSPRWLLAQGRVDEAIAVFEEFGVRVRDRSRLVSSAVRSVPVGGTRARVHGWLAPYARLFSGSRRSAVVFAILMIGLIPLNGIGQSVLGPYVLHEIGNFSAVGSLLGGSVIWIGALAGSFLAWLTLDRLGRIWSIMAVLIGFVVVYVVWATVAFGTAWLVPLYCLLGVVTWWGASACWPLPSELAPTEVRGRAQGLGSGLQRVSIGVNVLFIPHMLVWVGFRTTLIVVAGISVALIPLAMWGRQFEPTRKSLEVASGDELGAVPAIGLPDAGMSAGMVLSP